MLAESEKLGNMNKTLKATTLFGGDDQSTLRIIFSTNRSLKMLYHWSKFVDLVL